MLEFTERTWLWLAGAAYFTGFVLGTIALIRDRRHSRGVMYGIITLGFFLQTIGLYLRGLEVRGCPIGNTFEIFQFTAWSAIVVYLIVGATFRLSLLGYFTSMLSATLTLVSLALPAWDASRRINVFGDNPWIEFHAAIALFSYGVFGLLALTSIMFLLRHYSLKNKQLNGAFAFLPAIRDLDQISVRLLVLGFALLAASLAVGAVHWIQAVDTVNSSKLIVTVSVWLAYGIALGLRLRGTLVGNRFSWVCVALFAAALISLQPVDSSRNLAPETQAARRSS